MNRELNISRNSSILLRFEENFTFTNINTFDMKKLLLQLTTILLLASCSLSPGVKMAGVLVGAVGAGFVMREHNEKKHEKKVTVPDAGVTSPLTGAIAQLGGMLYDERNVIHVTHWPIKLNQTVYLYDKEGKKVKRTIIKKTVLADKGYGEADISILTLNQPVDLTKHDIIPISKAEVGEAVTIFRIRRDPFGTEIRNITDQTIDARAGGAEDSAIESGDSGKAWIARRGGKNYLISLTSRGYWGNGPNLYKYRKVIKETCDKINAGLLTGSK